MNKDWIKEHEEDREVDYRSMRAARSEYLAELRSDASDWETAGDEEDVE
jgi:hypothetical protein